MTLRYLFVDFNSYFASVEQLDEPALRGRPVAVIPVASEGTCCIAASYQAKAFGVKTGTGVRQARQRCPDIVFRLARPERYIALHHELMALIGDHQGRPAEVMVTATRDGARRWPRTWPSTGWCRCIASSI